MAEDKQEWYVLRAISGKEAKVKEILDAAIKNSTLGDYVSQVLIPTEKVVTTRNNKRVEKERILYSGYVFIKARLTGEIIYELRNTTNVIDFLRSRTTNDPEPVREAEVMRMLGTADSLRETAEDVTEDYLPGEPVKVTAGAFSGFSGEIKEVNREKKKVSVEVKIFGRPTLLELEYSQVERV